MGLIKHICEFCGKEYEDYFKNSRYCSKECYKNFRKANAKLKEKQCPVCEKWFIPKTSSTVYCSKECSGIANRNRVTCYCDNCGKPFERIKSEVDNNTKHFCSKECKYEYICWSDEDKLCAIYFIIYGFIFICRFNKAHHPFYRLLVAFRSNFALKAE